MEESEKKYFLKIGDIFAERYEIKRILGKGGQGEVYEVLDLQSNTREVLKILTDIENHNSFRKEIAALKTLNHEGIVRIYDGDISSEKPYYTMEYLEGLPLNQFIQYCNNIKDIETIVIKLLEAIKYLHETGNKLPRDIKSSNIFVVFREKE
ncbi:MAG: protein kinase, partial [Acidobacteria bacterium]|nr:protein kinase [Acidobacteriota bacterium]